MRHLLVLALFCGLMALPAAGQRPQVDRTVDQTPPPSPSKMLKQQHDELKKLSSKLTELANQVEEDLDKGGENVLPLNTLKKLDEIEKLARKMRSRIKQ
jgi:ABC-type transporter Mla subunit MlaD